MYLGKISTLNDETDGKMSSEPVTSVPVLKHAWPAQAALFLLGTWLEPVL